MAGLMYWILIGLTIILQTTSIPVPQNCDCSSTVMKCSKQQLTGIPHCQEVTYVEILDVSYNNIKVISNSSFSNFPNVKEMHLNNAHIKLIEKDAFKSTPFLETVDLSNNYIGYIEPSTFADSTNLHSVTLSNNPLQISQNEHLLVSRSVATLHLSHCQIRKLSNKILSGLPGLQTLDLSHNSLAHLSPDTFAGLTDLTVVDVSTNEWKCGHDFTTIMCWLHQRGQDNTIPAMCYDKQHKKLRWTVKSCTTVHISTEESEEELTAVTEPDQHYTATSTELPTETVTFTRTEATTSTSTKLPTETVTFTKTEATTATSTKFPTETVTFTRTEAHTDHKSKNTRYPTKHKDTVTIPTTKEKDDDWFFIRVFSVVDITLLTIVLIISIVGAIITGKYIAKHCMKHTRDKEILNKTSSDDSNHSKEHIYEPLL